MSEQKHTPGPWTAIEDHYCDSVVVVDANGFQHVEAAGPVAILLDYSNKLGIPHWADSPKASREIDVEEQAANARLIAAAPDLLTITKRLLDAHASAPDCVAFSEACDEFIEEARAALSKASA